MAHFKVSAQPVMAAPNIIPMADIMLVLLIIFMVVTPMLQKGMTVEMAKVPHATDMPNADRDDAVIVGISRSGDIFMGNQKTALDQITSSIRDRISGRVVKTGCVQSERPR